MTKVLVLYYSAYGYIEKMARAVADGVREAGATVDIKRVPELVPAEIAKASHYMANVQIIQCVAAGRNCDGRDSSTEATPVAFAK